MDPEKRKRLEAAGYVFGDFADFLGLDDVERKTIEFRADLAAAIGKLRQKLKMSRPAFGKLVGLARPMMDRLEIAAPEISLDLLLEVYFKAGGQVRYEFESPDVPPPASKVEPEKPAMKRTASDAGKSAGPRKVVKVLKA